MDYQMNLFDYAKKPLRIDKPIRMIELFAGYGSQSMALKKIGADFEHYFVCEFDKYAVASYNAVHGTDFPVTDIRDITGEDLKIVDTDKYTYIMTYSFPCTDLSVAGKMQGMSRGSGTRSGLLWEVERLLKETKNLPQILLMENVTQVCGKRNLADWEEWKAFLESLGYSNYHEILNAKDYGVAQNRNRCFMVSCLGKFTYEFPKPIELTKCIEDYLQPEEEIEEKYYLSDEKTKTLIDNAVASGKYVLEDGCLVGVEDAEDGSV